jgi:hypothetical protein
VELGEKIERIEDVVLLRQPVVGRVERRVDESRVEIERLRIGRRRVVRIEPAKDLLRLAVERALLEGDLLRRRVERRRRTPRGSRAAPTDSSRASSAPKGE